MVKDQNKKIEPEIIVDEQLQTSKMLAICVAMMTLIIIGFLGCLLVSCSMTFQNVTSGERHKTSPMKQPRQNKMFLFLSRFNMIRKKISILKTRWEFFKQKRHTHGFQTGKELGFITVKEREKFIDELINILSSEI